MEKKNKQKIPFKQRVKNYFIAVKNEFTSESPKTMVKNILLMVIGSFILALAYQLFYFPLNIVSGGVSGIAIIISEFTPLVSDGNWTTILTWILFFVGLIFLGPKFSSKTLISTVCYTIFLPLAQMIYDIDIFNLTSDMYKSFDTTSLTILAGLFGGGLTGIGCAVTFIGGGSTGGVDCLVLIVNKFTKIKVGVISFIIDAIIILSGFFIFKNMVSLLIGIMAALVCSILIDKFFLGGTKQYLAFIVSPYYKEISHDINYKLERGTTLLESVGGFTNRKGYTIKVCFDRKDYNDLIKIINQIDPKAFVSIVHADEINGYGFSKFKLKKKYFHIKKKVDKNTVPLEEITPLNDYEKAMEDIRYKNKRWY